MTYTKKELSEPGRQFAEIFEEYHDPLKHEQKKIKDNRERRKKQVEEDNGI